MSVLGSDIVHHIYTRLLPGRLVVIADEPFLLLRVMRKHWLQLEKSVQRERAKTLHAARIAELSAVLQHMQHMRFITLTPAKAPEASVFFLSVGQLTEVTEDCHTVYATCALTAPQRLGLSTAMQPQGLMVEYFDHMPS